MYRKWKPSKRAVMKFVSTMNDIDLFCSEHGIRQSVNSDSYYFTLNGQKYRVSNHTIEKSNQGAYKDGEQVRALYHELDRQDDTIYIHASKTRLIEIYEKLQQGYKLDGTGHIIF